MKRSFTRTFLPLIVVALVLGGFAWTLVFLYQKSQAKPVRFRTAHASVQDVIKKTVAPGAIVPRREVVIKPRVSGVLQKLSVEPGQQVKTGDLIATIQIIPNVVNLNAAEARLEAARITMSNTTTEHERLKRLLEQQLIAQTDYSRAELDYQLAQQELSAAKDNLELVQNGAIRGSGKVSNQVRSTVAGMVIEVPVEEGASVIESNNFNEGTTIASVANMTDMVFEGHVDESEVGKLREAMPVSISIGAIEGERYEGRLEYISPKGMENEGTIEFEIKAALDLKPGRFVRANYSANADVILERRDQVLTVEERLVLFENEKTLVEVEVAPQSFEKREVRLGLSDGIIAEVIEGITADDALKVPLTGEPPP